LDEGASAFCQTVNNEGKAVGYALADNPTMRGKQTLPFHEGDWVAFRCQKAATPLR